MKKSRFSEQQIINILKQADSGAKVQDVCRQFGISDATYYKWKSKYGGMEASDIKRLQRSRPRTVSSSVCSPIWLSKTGP
jgi:putative transposase